MEDPIVLVERRGPIGIITLNRPKIFNAIDAAMLLEIENSLTVLEKDAEIHVIILTGAGDRAFMAGGDIAHLNSRRGLAHYEEFAVLVQRVFRRFELSDKPIIAAINGYAFGGGMELLLATDIRLMADTARVGLTEISLGLFPGGGGTQRAPRQLAPHIAKELMFTGDHIDAKRALDIGLINHVVPAADLMQETIKLAERIAAKSPLVLKLMKRTIEHGSSMPIDAALAYEASMISLVLDSDDAHEGCQAFLDKRTPRFTGR